MKMGKFSIIQRNKECFKCKKVYGLEFHHCIFGPNRKKSDDCLNRIVIPKQVIDAMGRYFYLEIYKDKIVLKPLKKEQYSGR